MRAAAQKDFSTALHLEQTPSPPLPPNPTGVSDIMIQLSKLESSLGSATDRPEPATWPPRHLSSSETSGGDESPRYRSDAVGVQYVVGSGRGVVAARDVKKGEVVMTERAPFAAVDTHPEPQNPKP